MESSSGGTSNGDGGVLGKEESKREMRKGEREIGLLTYNNSLSYFESCFNLVPFFHLYIVKV